MTHEQKASEEAKRDQVVDPIQRWKDFQTLITWLEANMPESQRRNHPRWHKMLPTK